MKKADYIVFDTETGGFDASESPILEIALIALDGDTLQEVERYETYIKPYDDLTISKDALKANGIVMADVMQNGLTKAEAFKEINAFFKRRNPRGNKFNKPIMVGHNVQFDMGFMEMFYYFNKEKDLYDTVSRSSSCTMLDAKRLNVTERLDLTTLCEHFKIELSNAHRAMPDTAATAELFVRLTEIMRGNVGKVQKTPKVEKEKTRVKFQF